MFRVLILSLPNKESKTENYIMAQMASGQKEKTHIVLLSPRPHGILHRVSDRRTGK